jgi:endonuclease YncB( thermonuclease family)
MFMHFMVLITVFLGTGTCSAATIVGRIVGVADGDTVTLLASDRTQHKIRIAGIDAPEKKQAYGAASKAHMSELVFGKDAEATCEKVDKYRRDVCVLRVWGQDIGLEQINGGFAWWYRDYADEQSPEDRKDYEQAETYARSRKLGLWSDPAPIKPSDWRHDKSLR